TRGGLGAGPLERSGDGCRRRRGTLAGYEQWAAWFGVSVDAYRCRRAGRTQRTVAAACWGGRRDRATRPVARADRQRRACPQRLARRRMAPGRIASAGTPETPRQ